jgi:hypothetical protein
MSKKVRRVKGRTRAAVIAAEKAANELTVDDFEKEYAYVFKDMRQVLILAIIMFTLLIVLNLLLQ